MTSPAGTTPSGGRPPAEQGVIYDIGYRNYTGPRLGRRHTTRALLVESLRGAYGLGRSARSKVFPMILFAIMCLPAVVIVAVVNATHADTLPLAYTSYFTQLQFVAAIYLAAQAPQIVSRDLRFHTMPLYLSRPLRRNDYVLAKFVAMTGAMLVLLAAPLAILYGGALLARLPLGEQTRGLLQSLAGAALLALVLAGIGLVIAALTPRRGLGVAAIVTVLLVAVAVAGAIQGIAHAESNDTLSGYGGLLSPFTLVDGVQVWLFGTSTNGVTGPPGTTGGLVFALVTLAVVAGSYGLLVLRYRKVSVS